MLIVRYFTIKNSGNELWCFLPGLLASALAAVPAVLPDVLRPDERLGGRVGAPGTHERVEYELKAREQTADVDSRRGLETDGGNGVAAEEDARTEGSVPNRRQTLLRPHEQANS